MAIIVSKNGKNAKKLSRRSFREEAELQKYIFENPDSIPLEEIKENVQFIVLDKEFSVNVGSIDILGVDNEGDIYIIETKLYRNPDKRQVLAQVLDYGASLWESFGSDPDSFIQKLDQKSLEKTNEGLREKLESAFGNADEVIEGMKQNISNGIFRFIILMDNVPRSLKNLILFMNQNSQFSIYAVELEYYVHEGYEILIPHVFGAESKKKVVPYPAGKRKKWDEDSFFKDAKERIGVGYEAVRKLYEFSKKYADEISWGTGPTKGSFNPKFYSISKRSVYTVRSDGCLIINFGWLNDNENTIKWREKLLEKLKRIEGLATKIPRSAEDKWVSLPIEIWGPRVDEIILLLKKLLEVK